jgi:iron-sulfur cluster protein
MFAQIDAKFAKYAEEEMSGRKPNVQPEILGVNPYGENTIDNWSGTITEAVPDTWTVIEPRHTAADPPCWRILEVLAVLPNGKVRVETTDDELVIGDINETPMAEIYFGDKHKALIKDLAAGRWPEVCLKCSLYKPVAIEPAKLELLHEEAMRHRGETVETRPMNDRDLLPTAQFALLLGDRLLAKGDAGAAWPEYERALKYTVQLAQREQQAMRGEADRSTGAAPVRGHGLHPENSGPRRGDSRSSEARASRSMKAPGPRRRYERP